MGNAVDLDHVIAELRQLNQPVPRPLSLPTPDEVDVVEQRLGITFHPDYRKYLLQASDVVHGTLEPCIITRATAHTDLVRNAETAWEDDGVPRHLLPICYDNGDYYCMNVAGDIVYWSHNGITEEKWPDLAAGIKHVWIEGH